MYGLGNDFIVLDARADPSISSAAEPKRATALTDRKCGIVSDAFHPARPHVFPLSSSKRKTLLQNASVMPCILTSRPCRHAAFLLRRGCDHLIIIEEID